MRRKELVSLAVLWSAAVVAATVALSACALNAGSARATLFVQAAGRVTCLVQFPHGCSAYFLVEPASWDGTWQASHDDPRFDAVEDRSPDGYTRAVLTGAISRAPKSLAPGAYRLAAGSAGTSDVLRPGETAPELYASEILCTADLTVETFGTNVDVRVAFSDRACQIAIWTTPTPQS
jgi:hypothetical protein